MASRVIWEDRYGEVIDRPEAGYIEIRWYDTTRELDGETFNQWLAGFAGAVEETKRAGVLTDAVVFNMDMGRMDMVWRDTNIIPRYNAAGVKKFAFLMPEGMPAIGTPPQMEGPAEFPTGYFGRRVDAVAWLVSDR